MSVNHSSESRLEVTNNNELTINNNNESQQSTRREKKTYHSRVDGYSLIGDGSKKQMKHMLSHLVTFLSSLDPPLTIDELNRSHVNEDFMKKYVKYLGSIATNIRKPTEKLKLSTAEHYLSQFKNYLLCHFGRDILLPACMHSDNWGVYMALLTTLKRQEVPAGQSLVTPRQMATKEDRMAMAACCFWKGDSTSAEFHLFLQLSFQVAARVSEVAPLTIKSTHLFSREDSDDYNDCPYNVLELDIYRQKMSQFSKSQLFPHRDTVLFDVYFAFAYCLLLTKTSTTNILPSFAQKMKKRNDGQFDSTKVSSLFTTIIRKMYSFISEYTEYSEQIDHNQDDVYGLKDFNPNITGHCSRKATMNEFAEGDIPFYNWMFRVGFETRHIHTIFDYVNCASKEVDANSGKYLAGWRKKSRQNHNSLSGGHTVSLSVLSDGTNLSNGCNLAKECAEFLWRDHIAKGLEKKVAYLLFPHVILNLDAFTAILENEPKGKYNSPSSPQSHPFMVILGKCFEEKKVSNTMLKSWKDAVALDFLKNNSLGLPSYRTHVQVTPEVRSLQDQLDNVSEMLRTSMGEVHILRQENQHLRRDVVAAKVALFDIQDKQNRMLQEMKVITSFIQGPQAQMQLQPHNIQNDNEGPNHTGIIGHTPDIIHHKPSAKKKSPASANSLLWANFVKSIYDKNLKFSDKFVLYHTTNVKEIFLARENKKTRTSLYNIKYVIDKMVYLLKEAVVLKDNRNQEEWESSLKIQGLQAEKLLFELLNLKLKDTPAFTNLFNLLVASDDVEKGIISKEKRQDEAYDEGLPNQVTNLQETPKKKSRKRKRDTAIVSPI